MKKLIINILIVSASIILVIFLVSLLWNIKNSAEKEQNQPIINTTAEKVVANNEKKKQNKENTDNITYKFSNNCKTGLIYNELDYDFYKVCANGTTVGVDTKSCKFKTCKKYASNINTNTSNWKTYTNKKYGFSIKYPPDWIIKTYQENNITFTDNKCANQICQQDYHELELDICDKNTCNIVIDDEKEKNSASEVQSIKINNDNSIDLYVALEYNEKNFLTMSDRFLPQTFATIRKDDTTIYFKSNGNYYAKGNQIRSYYDAYLYLKTALPTLKFY